MTMQQEVDWGGYHPLFLPDDGAGPEDFPPATGKNEIKLIQVSRVQHGETVAVVPGRLDPSEIRTEQDILGRYGPGTYVLTARNQQGHIYAKRKYTVSDPNAPPVGVVAGVPAPIAPQAASGHDAMFLAMMQMMQASQNADRDREARAAAERERSQREHTQMMIAQMQQNTQMLVAVLGQAAQGAAAQSNSIMGIVSSLLTQARSQGSPSEAIKSLQSLHDLAKNLGPNDSGGWSDIAQAVGGFLGGMAQAQAAAVANQQPAKPVITVQADQPAPPVPPPNGPLPQG